MKSILALASALALAVPSEARAQQCPEGTPPPCPDDRRRAAPPAPMQTPTYRQLTTSGDVRIAAVSPDGRWMVYVTRDYYKGSERGQVPPAPPLMVRNLVGAGPPVAVMLEAGRRVAPMRVEGVQWFPDGTRLLVWGLGRAAVVSLGGRAPRRPELRRLRSGTYVARLSPDGRRVAEQNDACLWTLCILDAQTGTPVDSVRVPGASYLANDPVDWSPDGRFLVVITQAWPLTPPRFALRTVSTGDPSARVVWEDSVPLQSPRWDARASAIYYLREVGGVDQLWKVPVSAATGMRTGPPTLVLPLLEGSSFDLVEHGRHLAFVRFRGSTNGDVVLIENFDPTARPAPPPGRR